MKKIFFIILCLASIVFIILTIQGKNSLFYYQNDLDTAVGGPFETSNSTSRYALTKAIVERHSFTFDEALAKFAAPDLVHYNDKFFSVFLPGVSFLGVPLYYLGSILGYSQLSSYLLNVLCSIIASFLIVKIARKLGGGVYESYVAGFLYLFTTNVFSYMHTFTQHPVTAMLLLFSFLNVFGKRTFGKDIWFGILLGTACIMDIPNILIFLPFAILVFLKHFVSEEKKDSFRISMKLTLFTILFAMLPILGIFAWYNYQLTGSYTKIGQTMHRSKYPAPDNEPKEVSVPTAPSVYESKLAYNPRLIFEGLYVLLVSNERGIVYYEPAVLIGLLGIFWAYKRRRNIEILLAAVGSVLITLVSYSMFGDPWGGWAFGPRYLIPAVAILCVFVGPGLRMIRKYPLFLIFCVALTVYSIYVNALGALTTTAIPPKQEAERLITPIPYTYQYNLDLLNKNLSSSLVYNLFLSRYIQAKDFFSYFVAAASVMSIVLYGMVYLKRNKDE